MLYNHGRIYNTAGRLQLLDRERQACVMQLVIYNGRHACSSSIYCPHNLPPSLNARHKPMPPLPYRRQQALPYHSSMFVAGSRTRGSRTHATRTRPHHYWTHYNVSLSTQRHKMDHLQRLLASTVPRKRSQCRTPANISKTEQNSAAPERMKLK